MPVSVKDNNNVVHEIDIDTLPDGTQTQAVKVQIGNTGLDGGYVDGNNPLPVVESGFIRTLMRIFGRFSFSSNSSLRVDVGGTNIGTVSAVTTCSTVSTSNTSVGDCGKTSTAIMFGLQTYDVIRKNFTKV